ncbi:MAG TPA: glycosyltransferase family 39 protein [bacterium]|nr:glycosyltransferase family 39 protein [bacterium]HPN44167.1 glycosyltransferase family 39 protein [bacterium]
MPLNKKHFLIITGIYLLIQFAYVLFLSLPFSSDSLRFYELARDCQLNHTFYPGPHNHYDDFIDSPVYVNYVLLLLNLVPSAAAILFMNIVLNLLQLYLLMITARKLFNNENYALLAGLLYILYLTNLGAVLLNVSEFLFGICMLGSFYCYLQNQKRHWLLCGILLGVGIGVRQVGFALLFSYITLFAIAVLRKQAPWRKMACITGGMMLVILATGLIIKSNFGMFMFTANSGPQNILMGANDYATGSYNTRVFAQGNAGYIENLAAKTPAEKQAYWKQQSVNWIQANPVKWLLFIPKKLFYMFAWDDWSINTLMHTTDWNLHTIAKMAATGNTAQIMAEKSLAYKAGFLILYLYHHLFYFIVLALMAWQFYYYHFNRKIFITEFLVIYLFAFYGIAITVMSVGAARYKYPYFIMLLPTIIPMLVNIHKNKIRTKRV